MGGALDLRSTGCGFKSYSGQKLCDNCGQVVHTYVPLSPSRMTLADGSDSLVSMKVNDQRTCVVVELSPGEAGSVYCAAGNWQ